jgi:hypothetical protein
MSAVDADRALRADVKILTILNSLVASNPNKLAVGHKTQTACEQPTAHCVTLQDFLPHLLTQDPQ